MISKFKIGPFPYLSDMRILLGFLVILGVPDLVWAQSAYDQIRIEFEGDSNPVGYFWRLGYEENLELTYTARGYREYREHFEGLLRRLDGLDASQLSDRERLGYEQMRFECELNAERSQLYYGWAKAEHTVKPGGIYGQPNGAAWYRHFVKSFSGSELSPEQVLKKAEAWIADAQAGQEDLEIAFGVNVAQVQAMASSEDVQDLLLQYHRTVGLAMDAMFPPMMSMDSLKMQVITDPDWSHIPAYYWQGTLYYQNPHVVPVDARLMPGLYLHEGIPGHHYQRQWQMRQAFPRNWAYLSQHSLLEGWATYAESITVGEALGLYQDAASRYGYWQYRLRMAVRMVMDVRVNYHGWTDEQALALWEAYFPNSGEDGARVLTRIKEWPGQVHSYLIGEEAIQRQLVIQRLRPDFSWVAFHRRILNHSYLPASVLPYLFTAR